MRERRGVGGRGFAGHLDVKNLEMSFLAFPAVSNGNSAETAHEQWGKDNTGRLR